MQSQNAKILCFPSTATDRHTSGFRFFSGLFCCCLFSAQLHFIKSRNPSIYTSLPYFPRAAKTSKQQDEKVLTNYLPSIVGKDFQCADTWKVG